MRIVNIHAAKTHLSRLVEEAAAGQDIVIAKAGRPVARLTAVEAPRAAGIFGAWKGKVRIRKDFDAPLPTEIAQGFGLK
jgi:prevent-host-death family protein